jgi:hypothetical protein
MINDVTPNLNLPLPHPANALEDDVLRLRSAFGTLDSKIAALDELLASDDLDLDTLTEIVEAVKATRDDLAALNTVIETEVREQLEQTTAQFENLIPLIYAGLN